jgi:hypothetical protein
VTPVKLPYFGLPVGKGIEGRVLTEVFSDSQLPRGIPTWEPSDAERKPRADLGEAGNQALLDQFVALGYIDELPTD